MEQEIWKDIKNGLYSVSSFGRVRSNPRDIETKVRIRHFKGKILKPEITQDGHCRVVLCNKGNKERVLIHRLVAENFLPNPNNLPVINHKDENPQNNNVENLEWCTIQYNNTYNEIEKRRGDIEGHNITVYNLKTNTIINNFSSMTKAAKYYNLSLTTLWRHVKNEKPIGDLLFKEEI